VTCTEMCSENHIIMTSQMCEDINDSEDKQDQISGVLATSKIANEGI